MGKVFVDDVNFYKVKKPRWWSIFTKDFGGGGWYNEYSEPDEQEGLFYNCLNKALEENPDLTKAQAIKRTFELIEEKWYEVVASELEDLDYTDFVEYGGHVYFTDDMVDPDDYDDSEYIEACPVNEDDYQDAVEDEIRYFEDRLYADGLISKKLNS